MKYICLCACQFHINSYIFATCFTVPLYYIVCCLCFCVILILLLLLFSLISFCSDRRVNYLPTQWNVPAALRNHHHMPTKANEVTIVIYVCMCINNCAGVFVCFHTNARKQSTERVRNKYECAQSHLQSLTYAYTHIYSHHLQRAAFIVQQQTQHCCLKNKLLLDGESLYKAVSKSLL